ncbi:MAG: dethiobiotin synthase [Nitrosomonadaceae bacterium]|nr:dethiobiotin synthase [Nitrosomonadaceae bacterium]|tara:strand:+ start:19177 stop:19842 length:666 start_codon:yes stop_codon:yes gene_type:complete
MAQSYFITGTDTGIGKTIVSCALLSAFSGRGKSAIGMKPVVTGSVCGEWADVQAIIAASSVDAPKEWVNPYSFVPPIAPHLAAKKAGIEIDISFIRQAYCNLQRIADVVIVEGVGGIMVPLNGHNNVADMACSLNLPLILVVGMRLGCLNHALMTAKIAQAAGLKLVGWVANKIDPKMDSFDENFHALKSRLNFPLLGVLPFDKNIDTNNFSTLLDISQLE